jgi:hypothetical protein
LRARQIVQRAIVVAFLAVVAIAVHESGHFIVYRLAGYSVHVTLQSVHPVGDVDAGLDRWAKLAGPVISLAAAVFCLVMARRRPSFAWATAAFTNATIRLFPLAMDVSRAVTGRGAFSDEGEVILAITAVRSARLFLLGIPIAAFLLAAVLAAREYHFRRAAALKIAVIYVWTLAIGIGIILIDELAK